MKSSEKIMTVLSQGRFFDTLTTWDVSTDEPKEIHKTIELPKYALN